MKRKTNNKNSNVSELKLNFNLIVFVFVSFGMSLIILKFITRKNALEEEKIEENFEATTFKSNPEPNEAKLKYWSICTRNFTDTVPSLRTHNRVFKRMNFEFVNASNGDDWDILWAIETPWRKKFMNHSLFAPLHEKTFRTHQKVNHFPGIASLVSKSYMNEINRKFDFILPSFLLPQDLKFLKKFISENPNKKLLEKNVKNRGVKIIDVKDIEVDKEEVFYQEFMDDPFLIDGHAFDFGVFVLITSFDPIRVYRYSDDVLLRFCSEKYHPFDADNRDKYVVRDGSIPVYEMPSFKKLYKNFSFSSKIMFENHIKNLKFDVKKFWEKIDEAISKIVKNSEPNVYDFLKKFNVSGHHFFELVRFDIILDKNLNPFVVEVNLSPNLTPAEKKYENNSLIYEQLIHNVVKMIGGGSYHEFWSRFDSTDEIVTNNKNLATSLTKCIEHDCLSKCNSTYCQQCQPCMTPEIRYQLSEAFREHQNAANFERVFPLEDHFNDEKLIKKMTKNNQIQMRWFKGKCQNDKKWC